MSTPQQPRRYKRATIHIAAGMAWDAVSALTFITDEKRWPAFAAWAEQLAPSEPWTELDHQRMSLAARYFLDFAEHCDGLTGQADP